MRRLSGEHVPNNKNRSSKQLTWLTKIRPIYRCLNGATLQEMASNGNFLAKNEITRRRNLKRNRSESVTEENAK